MSKILNEQKALYKRAVVAYYNKDRQIMSDHAFDELTRVISEADPDWIELEKTGTRVVDEKIEVELPVFAPSLNKRYGGHIDLHVKSTGNLQVVTDKLDGTSLILEVRKHIPYRLFTRGDGELGGDVSFFLPFLIEWGKIPKRLPVENLIVRAEGVMSERVFEKKWATGDDKVANARSFANGRFNRKVINGKPPKGLSDVDFVVLHAYNTQILDGLKRAKEWGFNTVHWVEVDASTFDWAHHLASRRAVSKYKMDGLCASAPTYVVAPKANKKPKSHVAFKVNDADKAYTTKVLAEHWTRTRLNRWSCRVEIEPVMIDGFLNTFATAHNPAWMMERGVGAGATIKILRAGDVIPKIEQVVKPAPMQGPPEAYEQRGRFFYGVTRNRKADVRAIHFFMVTLGVKNLAYSTLNKLYDVGFVKASDYIEIWRDRTGERRAITERARAIKNAVKRFEAAGLGPVESRKKIESLIAVLSKPVRLSNLMIASGAFETGGMGIDKLAQLEAQGLAMRDLVKMVDPETTLLGYRGFAQKTAMLIAEGVRQFKTWYRPIAGILTVDGSLPVKRTSSSSLSGLSFVFTGYRDAAQAQVLIDNGAQISKSFSGKTTALIYHPDGKASGKVEAAGARAMTFDQVLKKYGIDQPTR